MENVETIFLEPIIDRRKSFYKKAKILIDSKGNKYLQSYDSIIAEVKNGKVKINTDIYLWDSQTSLRHLKDFLYQLGFEYGNKQKLIELYTS